MVRPSPVLQARLKFTTKQVGFGFYKGNKTGSVGAHTQYGGYLVDWRKVRNYNVPDLTDFKLTPYVSATVGEKQEGPKHRDVEVVHTGGPLAEQLVPFFRKLKVGNPEEVENIIRFQIEQRLAKSPTSDEAFLEQLPPSEGHISSTEEPTASIEEPASPVEQSVAPIENEVSPMEQLEAYATNEVTVPVVPAAGSTSKTAAQKLKELKNGPRRYKESKADKRQRKSIKDQRKLLTKIAKLDEGNLASRHGKSGCDKRGVFSESTQYQAKIRSRAQEMARRLTW